MSYLQKILKIAFSLVTKNFLVIEAVELREEGKSFFLYNLVLLNKKKQEINIVRHGSGLDDVALKNIIADVNTKSYPSILIINSDKIYSGIADSEKDDFTLINTAIPEADAKELYIYRYVIGEKKDFISIARKSYIDSIITNINIPFINVAIGPFPLLLSYKLTATHTKSSASALAIGNYTFNFQNDELLAFSKTNQQSSFYKDDTTVTLAEKKILTSLLIPFSFGLYYYLNPVTDSFAVEKTKSDYEQYIFQKIGKLLSIASLTLIFICLAVSSILFTIYSKKYNDLESMYSASLTRQQKIKLLNDSNEKEEQTYTQLGILNSSKISYFLDQLIFSLPDDVYIKKLDVHPPLGRSFENPKFSYKTIFIEGNCFSGSDLNIWVNKLKEIYWIKEVTIKQYHEDNQNEIGNFLIEITTT